MASHRPYSIFVRILKLVLPLGGVVILALIIAWPFIYQKPHKRLTNVDTTSASVIENHMLKPKFASTDKKGRPFEVEAESGKPTTEHEADLVTPHGKITTQEHGDVILDAKTGHYDKDAQVLVLEEDVTLNTEDGYHFETEQADINIDTKTVDGTQPLKGHGPLGTVKAKEGFQLEETEDGNRILTLKGRSRIVINSDTLKQTNVK